MVNVITQLFKYMVALIMAIYTIRCFTVFSVKKEKKKRELKLNTKSIESRIDLRGMDSEEACYRTDKYLDEAYMCNLGEGIEERAIEKTKKEVILDMYQNGCNLELIATVTKKNISEIEEIINNSIVSLH